MSGDLRDVMAYDEAHYFNIGTTQNPNIQMGTVITQLDENSNPTEITKQYIHQKSKTTKVTGFSDEFPITQDLVKNEAVCEFFYDIFRNRKTGVDAQVEHFIVELWNEVSTNTYKARKQLQTAVLTGKVNTPGESINFSGTLKGVGDFVDGVFNTDTKTFTPGSVSL